MRLIGTAGYRWNVRAAAALVVVGAIAASVLTPLLPDRVWAGEPGESEGGGKNEDAHTDAGILTHCNRRRCVL